MRENPPTVSVVIPARDAAGTIKAALQSIAAQTYPEIVEVIVAAADRETAEAAEGATIVENPGGATPTGLNLALERASGTVIVRCDAHAVLPPGYVERAVSTLLDTGAMNVGGMQVPGGVTFWERAVAAAMSTPLGAGDARYRIGGGSGPVETVYLGVFRASVFDEVGPFDESFSRTQDYELNHRIIESGGVVWFDPELKVRYRPRGSLWSLARQYYEYGRAKRAFARKHPGSLRWRQLASPLILIGLAASALASAITPWALIVPIVYGLVLVVTGLALTRQFGLSAIGAPAALATMHLSWGAGFLTSPRPSDRRP